MTNLTVHESELLSECERTIEIGLNTFIDVGAALLAIRDKRLYRQGHPTFEDYCQRRWGMSRTYAHRNIEAAKVAQNLLPMGNIPANERQARPLAGLDPNEQREVWQEAVDTAPGGKVTARHVKEAAERMNGGRREQAIAATTSSESNEWYTPPEYLAAARAVMGSIDLDPASCEAANKNVGAAHYFTADDDGLAQDWFGRVWLNPPYGGMSGPFVGHLMEEIRAGRVAEAVVLVNANSTETNWFAPLWDYILCFTDHRIDFISPDGVKNGSTHGSAFAYIGSREREFYQQFAGFGYIVRRVRRDD